MERSSQKNEFVENLKETKRYLSYMSLPNKVLKPDQYRCYMAPAAVAELLGTFNWGGMSHSHLKRGNSPLMPMEHEGKSLSPKFTLKEDYSLGLHPRFNEEGDVFAESMVMIREGKLENMLTSSKTAKEFGVESNGANFAERMKAVQLEGGI